MPKRAFYFYLVAGPGFGLGRLRRLRPCLAVAKATCSGLQIPTRSAQALRSLRQLAQYKTPRNGALALRVAGPGFAPGSQGYEPCEVLLLHPAIYVCS